MLQKFYSGLKVYGVNGEGTSATGGLTYLRYT